MYRFSRRSINNMAGVHPALMTIFLEAIKDSPIDFGVPGDGGVRTAERQNEMFKDSKVKTNCDGYNKKSNHQIPEGEKYGKALDFFAYLEGTGASWTEIHLAMVASHIMATAKRLKREGKISVEIKWGGTFGSVTFHGWDYPHIEIV